MANNKEEIANLALSMCGTRRIVSLDDPSREARACKDNYDTSRKALLRMHPWNFAMERKILDTVVADGPAFGFTYKFALPDDFLRVIKVYDGGTVIDDAQWRIERIYLLSDSATIWLKYVFDATDTVTFDPLFDQALAAHIATKISPQLNASSASLQECAAQLKQALQQARFVDSTEDPAETLDVDEWLQARNAPFSGFVRDPMT